MRRISLVSQSSTILFLGVVLVTLCACSPCDAGTKSEPLVIVQNGKYGFIDHDGKIVIQPQFLWARDFWRGLGTVYVCGRYLSIDSAGTLLPLRIAIDGKLEV